MLHFFTLFLLFRGSIFTFKKVESSVLTLPTNKTFHENDGAVSPIWLNAAYSTIFTFLAGRSFSLQNDSPCFSNPCFQGKCRAKPPEEGYGFCCECREGFCGEKCNISK